MTRDQPGSSWSPVGWLVFPIVPVLLGRAYHEACNAGVHGGPDPREWSWLTWILLSGPLVGYGFLAGATVGLPDDPGRRGVRSWPSRRAVWVAVGPWIGFLAAAGLVSALKQAERVLDSVSPSWRASSLDRLPHCEGTWKGVLVGWTLGIVVVGTVAYGWLVVALAVVRRARRLGCARRAIERGVATAVGFVGSLFGSFWAITEAWRGHFFDPRIAPIVGAGLTLALLSGCGSPITYGELRRRELFAAMLVSWLLGLALTWRWWSRGRR